MSNILSIFKTDAYKQHHREQYPIGTTKVFSNLTPRNSKHFNCLPSLKDKVVVYGLKYTITKLIEDWDNNFFKIEWSEIESQIHTFIKHSAIDITKNIPYFKELHEFGKLPLSFEYIGDYTVVNINTPILSIVNTDDRFFWLVNYIETQLSSEVWALMTSANISRNYYELCRTYSNKTCDNESHLMFQCHDFSQRGISSTESSIKTGLGHLAYFLGSDTLPAIIEKMNYVDEYSDRSCFSFKTGIINYLITKENDLILGSSIPASEHSTMCAGGKDTEFETYERFLELYPEGIVSIVSDTWDYFNVIENYLPRLKDKIMSRNGKVVIRPDSGDPVDIILKSIPILDKVFGHTINSKGYKVLDSHIGLIYGDSITLQVATEVLKGLEKMGYASSNIVFGVGSYTYQYITRDTLGFAVKATAVEIDGVWHNIFKEPKGASFKKSLKGFFIVKDDLSVEDNLTYEQYISIKDESILKEFN